MGFLFAKFIEKAGSNEHIEITLTLLVAHLTFILSELISSHLSIFGHSIHLSAIIATVMASMVIGNYGRSKLSAGVEHFMERFWGYFAFVANSLVFITMGLLFAGLPINFGFFMLPILFAVIVVMVARALSVYPVAAWLNFTKKEKEIPLSWQHLMSWGSLRGALAVIMVMLIPDTLTLPDWKFDFTIKEFITALTIGCIYFTLFVKALTIGKIIKRYELSALTVSERIEHHQGRALIFSHGIDKLAGFFSKGYLDSATYEKLKGDFENQFRAECRECGEIFSKNPQAFEQALRVYALGIERYFLGILYRHQEISESVYKRILTKLDVQLERVEDGHVQIKSLNEAFAPDWFEQMAAFARKYFFAQMKKEEKMRNVYMYYRAQEIIARKVIKEIGELKDRSKIESEAYQTTINRVISAHQDFYDDAHMHVQEIVSRDPAYFVAINEQFGRQSFSKACKECLSELARKNILSSKLTILLEEEFSHKKI
jgi:CPA1 family monovalent cation:H+ antiporter